MDALLSTLASPDGSLASLALAAFLAATVVPLSSEAALFAVLHLHPDLTTAALAVATLANTAGGMTTYAIGRWIGAGLVQKRPPDRALERLRRFGAPALLLAWLPLAGDALCLAAGWLKINAWIAMAWQAAGRLTRYWVVAQGAAAF